MSDLLLRHQDHDEHIVDLGQREERRVEERHEEEARAAEGERQRLHPGEMSSSIAVPTARLQRVVHLHGR